MKSKNTKANAKIIKTIIIICLLLLLFILDYLSAPSLLSLYILGIYAFTHPKIYYHPANIVFANYFIYIVMPYGLWMIYKIFDIEYILPWGMNNDWSKLSNRAIADFAIVFTSMYFMLLMTVRSNQVVKSLTILNCNSANLHFDELRTKLFLIFNILVIFAFMQMSGGLLAWISNYSETYLLNRKGLGILNLYILWASNLTAFLVGYKKFIVKDKLSRTLIFLVLIALLSSIYVQGIKSRIPMLLFFYFAPYLAVRAFNIGTGLRYFFGLILLFLFGMYFRSDGFYNTPRMLIEYLQSYFNTIFLHNIVIADYQSGELGSILMGFNKYIELFGDKIPRESYDLAVYLTQIYFHDQWYVAGATQQWPLETDLFLSFPHTVFWIIPVGIYSVAFGLISKFLHKYNGFIFYVYCAELIRIMSIFRGGFLTWGVGLTILSYIMLFFIWIFIIKKRPNNEKLNY